MGTVAEKLTYLNGTKSSLKQAINNLGGDIDNNTTFRNYATQLDTIYTNLPKVSDTGTSVSLTPTLKGRLGMILQGDTLQDGTPSPSSPVEIQSATGTQNVVVSGKNLVNPNGSTTTKNGITFTNNGDGTFTVNGTATTATNFAITTTPIKLKSNTYYTQSITTISGTIKGSVVPAFKNSGGTITYNYFTNNQTKLTTDEMTSHTYNYYITSGTSVDNWTFKVQLEQSNSATPYQPYQEPQEVDIELGNIELNKISDYEDYIGGTPDNWVLYKNIGKVNIVVNNTITAYGGRYWIGFNKPVDSIMYGAGNFNRYKLYMEKAYYSNTYEINSYQTGLAAYAMGVMCNENDDATTLKNKLDGSLMYYPLAETQPTPITEEPLVSQLNELWYLMSNDDTTNIDVTGNLPMRITASAIKGE